MRTSSARAGSRQAPKLQRQTSVLNELQESQEKENFETRNARLMAELSALCSDRNNVLTPESLEFLATDGRPEPVKLEREPEKILDALQKSALGAKQDDLLGADAARRQRVEELTRFFMEAKSDIEFALGGSRDFSDPRSSRDKDADSEHDEDKDNETGDDDDEADKSDDAIDPERQLAKMHIRLLKDKIDNRVYNAMLSQIRENDPALYGAILCHPLITGVDLKRDKRKKKKRKERERREKSVPAPSVNAMLSPDFSSPRLSVEEMKVNIARFVSRAIADGSIQAQLLAVKLILSWLLDSDQTETHNLTLPLSSHLRVLRGEKAPEYPKRDVGTPKKSSEEIEELQQGEVTIGAQAFSEDKSTEEGSSITMDIEAESDNLTLLRARLGHFEDIEGEDDEGHHEHDEEENDDEDGEGAAEGEGVDEDALMARAIALSLSPEVNLKDESEAGPSPTSLSGASQPEQNNAARPSRFSPEEMIGLGPFLLPENHGDVPALTAALCLMAQVGKQCLEYLESCQKGVLPSSSSVQPHPVVFMLINSLLRDFISPLPCWCDGEHEIAFWRLFVSCSQFSTLRALEAHLFHIEVANVSPGSVGLGRISIRGETDQVSGPNRLVESIKSLVEQSIEETKTSSNGCTDGQDVVESVYMSSSCSTSDIDAVTDLYNSQVREHAVVAWARAISHFYPTQLNRHDLLVGLLRRCLRSSERNGHHRWKYLQLDLLCSRLSLPDLAQSFVPQTGDVVLSAVEEEIKNAAVAITSSSDDQKLVDDALIQTNGVKMFKKGKMWPGDVIRASLASGLITPRIMIDFLVEISSPEYMEKVGVTSLLAADNRAPEVLASAYEQFIENSKKEEQEALDCIKKLPDLVDLLRESVIDASWPLASSSSQLQLPHAPLTASYDNVADDDFRVRNPRLMLLRSLQDLLVQRVGGARGDEPPALEFDATRCAETMTLSDGNKTARQYTAKQWGMVMATTGCPPNSGIHEWAVRLDRCEKGHIFLGVCTRDASVATYVGGDRQGWGLIGTRALWHNRSKVRGDYGDGFSTGSVVRVRLNTDSGALSFGVEDSDWGIAFDGLTQHGTLYPAIGLYQRDDQVTILPVRTIDSEQAEGISTARGVREISVPAILQPFLHHSAAVLDTACRFLESLDLSKSPSAATAERSLRQHPILFPLVLPLVSSLSMLKSFHGLSSILAMHFVPWCTKLVRLLDQKHLDLRRLDGMSTSLTANISGEWELKSMAAGNIPAQQYHLTLTQAADGTVTGKSSGSFMTVTLSGTVVGTKIRFLETWRQGGTCLVEGRLRADGSAFEGCYEDAKSHTSGSIVGNKVKTISDSQDSQQTVTSLTRLSVLEVVCANLVGSFARALIDCDRPDLIIEQFTKTVTADDDIVSDGPSGVDSEGNSKGSSECTSDEYENWVDSLLLSGGLPPAMVQHHLNDVIAKVFDVTRIRLDESTRPALAIASREWLNFVVPKAATNVSSSDEKIGLDNDFVQDLINARGEAASVDRWVSRHVGESPFLRLGGEPMKVAKRTVCAAMLWHSGFLHLIKKLLRVSSDNLENSEERPHENLMHIWRAAQRVVEWAIRAKNSMGSTYAIVAALVIRKAEFLLKIEPSAKAVAASTAVSVLSQDGHGGPNPPARSAVYECAERIYSEVLMQVSRFLEAPVRISTIQSRMLAHSTKAFFRIIGMLSFRYFVGDVASPSSSTSSKSAGHEAIQQSFALSTAMQWLSPANHLNPTTRLVKEVGASSENGDSVFLATRNDAGHYQSGLGGCGKQLQGDIRDAFESLYGFLSAFLSKATWAHDADLQLVLLEAWGIVIQPDDHAFLSRVGIFRVLQTVLDDARSQDVSSMDTRLTSDASATTEERGRLAESRRCVIQATLKVVHLLAAQVAQDVTDAFAVPADTAVSSFGGLAVGAIPLLRKPSGPETLGKSVFHMLYTELKNALEDIRSKRSPDDLLVMHSSAEPAEGDQAPDNTSVGDANDSEEYCYQICSLLYSVSGSPVCRSHLSSSRWLRLLLVLLELGCLQIQRRALMLLRRILPDLDPVTIKLRPDAMDVFDIDSDDDYDDDASQDQAMTLINFFVGIVSSMNPPSLVEEMLRRLPGVNDNSCPKAEVPTGSTAGLSSEVVLLLRSLYESPKWSSHLSASLVEALRGLSTMKKTESSAPDSDVEMDDTKSRDLPSMSSWVAQSRSYMNALAALCVLDGHVDSLRVGAAVKILPKIVAGMQDISFRGARGIIVAYEPEKSAAEVLLKTNRLNDTAGARNSSSSPNRPIRVPVDDLVPVPDVELDTSVFSDDILKSILIEKFPFFVEEIRHSQESLKEFDGYSKGGDASMDEPDEDDDMSNDGSSSPSGMDSEMVGGNDSDEGESEVGSPRTRVVDLNEEIEPSDVLMEMEKETQLQRMLLCQHGLRAIAMLLRDKRASETFIREGGSAKLYDLLQIAISETPTAGLIEVTALEESWVFLWSRWSELRRAAASPAPKVTGEKKPDQENADAEAPPNPMVQQMMEMGFPKEWCEVALARCSQNVEAAINFCFEHSSDMERLVAMYKTSKEAAIADGAKSGRAEADALISPLLEQLAEMGFPLNWCKKALAANRNNVDAALTWILSNGEALEAEDRREEESKQRSADGGSSSVTDIPTVVDTLKPNPLRAVSGQASIGENDSMVEGLVGAGFPSVGAPDCLVSTGRWYYEATLHTNGCIQIGWADVAFCGAADRGDGVGDGAHSWAYDGWRQQKWHGQSSPWGSKWKQGDVVGCAVDADAGTILFSLNGKMLSANMGVAFRGVQFAHGLYPCASFNRRERLQFNLGGSPFKHPPPPGFRPILEVLCREGETIADLPKGFAVIGRREDCLEEAVGEENFSSDSRFFGRELHSSMSRSSGSHHTRTTVLAGSSRADMFAELKAIPDDRVHTELVLLSRSLAVLHARRALLTLLAKWPVDQIGTFSMTCFSQHESRLSNGATLFIDFIKLIASCSGGAGSPNGTTLGDSADIDEQLDYSSSGRQALNLLLSVTRSAIEDSLRQSNPQRHQLIDVLLSRITEEVKSASQRAYARVPWDATDAQVTASFLQLSSESGQSWSDKEVLKHPNVFLAEWFSRLLMDSLSRFENSLEKGVRNELQLELVKAWIAALKSPGLCVKEKAFGIIGGLLQDILLKTTTSGSHEGSSPAGRDLVSQVLQALPLNRLLDLADERLLKEYPQLPVCSRYLQSIVELVSAGSLASSILGHPIDTLFSRDISTSITASQKLESDLYDINKKEYDEENEKRRKLAEDAAAKAAEEEAAAAAAAAAAVSATTATTDSIDASASEGLGTTDEIVDQPMQELDVLPAPVSSSNDGGVSGMEIDSDSEENPDITLSAIANMVAEDSDVVTAAAAIAAAAQGRLTIKHAAKTASEESVVPETDDFKLSFPEEKIDFDTSLLNDEEKRLLAAGIEGIHGDEPLAWSYGPELGLLSDNTAKMWSGQVTQFKLVDVADGEPKIPDLTVGCKVTRGPNWKWRDQDGGEGSIGIVEGVSPWSGVEGEGMSVRWPNDSLYTYRWGADGNYDLIHVEVDQDGNITKRYPTPQVKPEDEGSFGCEVHLGVMLHLFESEGGALSDGAAKLHGVMEWPDFGSAIRIVGAKYPDGRIMVQELQMVRGNPDMGWTLRFGSEKWQPGTKYHLQMSSEDDNILVGEYSHMARRGGKLVEVRGELKLSTKTLFTMDPYNHFSTLTVSDEGMTVTCNSGESRNLALGTVGFATGVHYWEVRVDQAEFGSVFIGVCEKAGPPGSQAALASRLNRWTGWGFVNFRATYHNSTERIYGDHFNAGDTIGVRLDMEQGKLSFFMDGMKFGEHIVADLGVAFENMKGERNTRTLYPCIGMRKCGDRVALNGKWVSIPGVSSRQLLSDVLDVSASLHSWYLSAHTPQPSFVKLSDGLLRQSWQEWKRWKENRWQRYPVRPRGVLVDFDTYPSSCIKISNSVGLSAPFLAGDRVRISSTYGRELTQPEEAVILGVYRGHLWYRTETQGNEGADEGRSWAWYFSPSELAELLLVRRNGKDMTLIENSATDVEESLTMEVPFNPRSDLEARAHNSFEAFVQLATSSHTPASDMQLVERLNTFCAASGVDITNLRMGDVLTPSEAVEDKERVGVRKRSRTQSFVPDEYFSSPALKSLSGPELRARCAVLRVFNGKVLRALPLIALQSTDSAKDIIEVSASSQSGVAAVGSSSDYPSTSVKLRSLRRLIFTSTKRSFWDDVLRATTTSTPLPSDEYEDPREIRTIRINRIQAQASKLSLLAQPSDRLRRSVFGQLYREMRTWNDSSFRRAYVGKGHGGQRRAFKVKFLGEGVNDYGGPYRAVFEQVVDELQLDNVELSKGEQGLLPLLIPCPNRRSGTGSNQDKFLLNPSCGASLVSNGPVALDLHRFLGKIVGTAVRHGLQMGLDLPSLVWRPLAGLDVGRAHLESIDVVTANNLTRVEEADEGSASDILDYLSFSTTLSDGTEVPLCTNGDKNAVTLENRAQYVDLVEKKRLTESQQQLAALRDGLSAVLPMELAPLFTPRELEVLICGRREVDVELLRQCTEYGEGVDESMTHVQAFWDVLKEMSSDERTSFLRFVWARSRMPNSAKDFPMNFKVQTAHDSGAQVDPDKYLPHAQTCFFALRLPAYTSKEVLRDKLLYAIQNSPNMDADVRLHNAEGWADA